MQAAHAEGSTWKPGVARYRRARQGGRSAGTMRCSRTTARAIVKRIEEGEAPSVIVN